MIGSVLVILIDILTILILIRVLISWLPMLGVRVDPYNPFIRALFSVVEPILEPIRRFTSAGMMDFSPIVALLILIILRRIVASLF